MKKRRLTEVKRLVLGRGVTEGKTQNLNPFLPDFTTQAFPQHISQTPRNSSDFRGPPVGPRLVQGPFPLTLGHGRYHSTYFTEQGPKAWRGQFAQLGRSKVKTQTQGPL